METLHYTPFGGFQIESNGGVLQLGLIVRLAMLASKKELATFKEVLKYATDKPTVITRMSSEDKKALSDIPDDDPDAVNRFNVARKIFEYAKEKRSVQVVCTMEEGQVESLGMPATPIEPPPIDAFSGVAPLESLEPEKCDLTPVEKVETLYRWRCPDIIGNAECGTVSELGEPCTACKSPRNTQLQGGRWKNKISENVEIMEFKWKSWECALCNSRQPIWKIKCARVNCSETFIGYSEDKKNRVFTKYVPPKSVNVSGGSYTTADLCQLAKPKDNIKPPKCACCPKPPHGNPDYYCDFSTFYDLEAGENPNNQRSQILGQVLQIFGQCKCTFGSSSSKVLLAIPRHGRTSTTFYVRGVDNNARDKWKRDKKKIPGGPITGLSKFPVLMPSDDGVMYCHIVPLSAGGCVNAVATKENVGSENPQPINIIRIDQMCPLCQALDAVFTLFQSKKDAKDLLIAEVVEFIDNLKTAFTKYKKKELSLRSSSVTDPTPTDGPAAFFASATSQSTSPK